MSRTDDMWDIIESVGATALGVAGLAGTTAQPNVDGRSLGGARCVPFANPSVLDIRQRVRWEIARGRRPLKRRVVSVVPRPTLR